MKHTSIALALLAVTVSASAQSQPPKLKLESPSPDTWQKMKECAAQAEKTMAERNDRAASAGAAGAPLSWRDHYSPKYNRCYVQVSVYSLLLKDTKDMPKWWPFTSVFLSDAFERQEIAKHAPPRNIDVGCADAADPDKCKQVALELAPDMCQIEDKPAPCSQAQAFIEEHMNH